MPPRARPPSWQASFCRIARWQAGLWERFARCRHQLRSRVCPGDGLEAGHGPVVVGPGPYHRPMSGSASGPARRLGRPAGPVRPACTRPSRPGARVSAACAAARPAPGTPAATSARGTNYSARACWPTPWCPVSYAVKGTAFAADLWRYKAGRPDPAARTTLLALLLAFLHDHGALRVAAGRHGRARPPGRGADRLRPSGAASPARAGRAVPAAAAGPAGHPAGAAGPRPRRSPVSGRTGGLGADVLLLEDSWVSGASAQSAAAALKRAGAGRVAVMVLGRHLDPADRYGAALAARLVAGPGDPGRCAVHEPFRALRK